MAKTIVAIILCLGFLVPAFAAAPAQPKATTSQTKPAKPDWSELTLAQRNVLAPLRDDWDSLDTVRRDKWVKVANQYPKMKPEQQQRLQAQMKNWVKLTSEQRRAAREKYKTIKKLPPAKRDEIIVQWQQYQQSLAAKPEPASQEITTSGNPQ